MGLPFLIVGGNKKLRQEKAFDLANSFSSRFDQVIVEATKEPGIETVRLLKGRIARRPFESLFQTIILLEAQNFTLEAQNALLKNLEEPPDSVKIILTAATTESLLSTVFSRCQKIYLPIKDEEIVQEQFAKFSAKSFYQRYQLAASLDLESWLIFWRKVLLESCGVHNRLASKTARRKILNYVKLLSRSQSWLRRKANPKLLKAWLLFEAPFETLK